MTAGLLLYAFALSLEFAALVRLRKTEPELRRATIVRAAIRPRGLTRSRSAPSDPAWRAASFEVRAFRVVRAQARAMTSNKKPVQGQPPRRPLRLQRLWGPT